MILKVFSNPNDSMTVRLMKLLTSWEPSSVILDSTKIFYCVRSSYQSLQQQYHYASFCSLLYWVILKQKPETTKNKEDFTLLTGSLHCINEILQVSRVKPADCEHHRVTMLHYGTCRKTALPSVQLLLPFLQDSESFWKRSIQFCRVKLYIGIKTRDERTNLKSYPAKSRSSWPTSMALSAASNVSRGKEIIYDYTTQANKEILSHCKINYF